MLYSSPCVIILMEGPSLKLGAVQRLASSGSEWRKHTKMKKEKVGGSNGLCPPTGQAQDPPGFLLFQQHPVCR